MNSRQNRKENLLIMVSSCVKGGKVVGYRAATYHSMEGAKPKSVMAKTRTDALRKLTELLYEPGEKV